MDNDVEIFLGLLARATRRIEPGYFRLEVAGLVGGAFRERVYAYELYHQLRSIWPNRDEWGFVLNGEVDKRGHPLPQMRRPFVRNRIPDLLVHRPGDMRGNLVIIEIKAAPSDEAELREDLQKLVAFCDDPGYRAGILLLIGSAPNADYLHASIRTFLRVEVPNEVRDRILVYQQEFAMRRANRMTFD